MNQWDIITGEYPPQPGGVSDYTRSVALGLAEAGDRVRVWAPPCQDGELDDLGVTVHRLPDHFRRQSLKMLTRNLAGQSGGGRILLQYVPHSFGWKAMNVPFCLWLFFKSSSNVWIICHEVAVRVDWKRSVRSSLIGTVNRLMSLLVARTAKRIWVTIPAWKVMLARVAHPLTPIECLPVPSTIQVVNNPESVKSIRLRVTAGTPFLVGHFGTYRDETARMLVDLIPALFNACPSHLMLLGKDSQEFAKQAIERHPEWKNRITASGMLLPKDLSAHLAACDLMIQPYPDGVSGRRTSMMACLAHGVPIITNQGEATEEYWAPSGAVRLVSSFIDDGFPIAVRSLLGDSVARERLTVEARRLYQGRFTVDRVIGALRAAAWQEEYDPCSAMACHLQGKH